MAVYPTSGTCMENHLFFLNREIKKCHDLKYFTGRKLGIFSCMNHFTCNVVTLAKDVSQNNLVFNLQNKQRW